MNSKAPYEGNLIFSFGAEYVVYKILSQLSLYYEKSPKKFEEVLLTIQHSDYNM